MQSVDIALIGHGAWGEKIAHTLGRVDRARLDTVCDVSEPARERARALSPRVHMTASFDEVLGRQATRAAIIATPPSTHAELALRALEAGLDVMVEKPMALCLEQARELEQAARAAGRVLMVGHILEYHPAVVELRRRIERGELGAVRLVVSERLSSSQRRHENAWWSLGPHDVSVLRLLTGRTPTRVSLAGWAKDEPARPDVVAARVEIGEGSLALAHFSLVDAEKVRRIVVVGSEGVAVFDDLKSEQRLCLFDSAEIGRARLDDVVGLAERFDPARQSARDVLDGVAPARWLPARAGLSVPLERRAPLELETEHFVSGVLDGTRVQSDATSGREVVAVLEAGQRSLDAPGASGEDVSLD
jgi:predicted dehydrogenase